MLSSVQSRFGLAIMVVVLGTTNNAWAHQISTTRSSPTFNGARSQGGYSTTDAMTGAWQTIDVFTVPNLERRLPTGMPWIEYLARRTSGGRGEAGQITWTSSRDCPALYNTLVWMTGLVAPRIEIAGVTPNEAEPEGRRPVRLVADGLETMVWGRGTQPDHTVNTRVEITSNGGLVAEFGRTATTNLMPCWRLEQPIF